MPRRWLLPAVFCVLALGFSLLLAQPSATFNVTDNDSIAYTINGTDNPDLNLVRGQTYTFQVSAPGHPFWIKAVRSTGTGNAFNSGVTNNGTQSGTVTFVVPASAPATLFYNCQFHSPMTGAFHITDGTPALPLTWGRAKAIYR